MSNSQPSFLALQYNNPAAFPPVIHICEIMCRSGFDVHVLGVEGKDTIGLTFPNELAKQVSIRKQPTSRWSLPIFWLYFNLAAAWKAIWLQPAVVHISDYTSCLSGILISWLVKTQVIYHEHDSPEVGGGLKNRLLMRVRKWLARRANVCILPNAERARVFESQTECRKPPMIVWNCPTKAEVQSVVPSFSDSRSADSLRIAYAGTINDCRVPQQLIHALALCPGTTLTLIGYETIGSLGYIDKLTKLAEQLGVADQFKYEGPRSRSEVLSELVGHDLCLGLMPMEGGDINTRAMVGASNKAFDAFACALPIVASDLDDWKTAYVAAGVAMECDPRSANSIAKVFQWYQQNPERRREMGNMARKMVEQQWNYEHQFDPVLNAIGIGQAQDQVVSFTTHS